MSQRTCLSFPVLITENIYFHWSHIVKESSMMPIVDLSWSNLCASFPIPLFFHSWLVGGENVIEKQDNSAPSVMIGITLTRCRNLGRLHRVLSSDCVR